MDYKSLYSRQIKLGNFLNKTSGENPDDSPRYKLIEIDHPNGWSFSEIDQLGEMGFKIDNDTDMVCEVEVQSLEMEDEKVPIKVYKDEDGYVLETTRLYVFESFNKMIEFIESTKTDPKMRGLNRPNKTPK